MKLKLGISSSINLKSGLTALLIMLFSGCGGSNDADSGDGFITLQGRALLPAQVSATRSGAANAPFQVVDAVRAPAKQVVFQGTTDAEGNYSVTISQTKVAAVIVSGQGPSRIAGLVSADHNSSSGKAFFFQKDFDEVTDIACEAGLTAMADGSVSPDDFDDERIANLEAGARIIFNTTAVNEVDPASVTAAATLVRALTNDGEHFPN